MTIREATDDDLPAIIALRRRWTAEDVGAEVDDPGFAERFTAWWEAERGRRRFWVAELHSPVGFANLSEFTRMPRPGRPPSRWGYISNVYVLPEHRDLGIGARLLDTVVADARASGYVRLVLSPSERSKSFYARAGFDPADGSLVLRTLVTE